jgi:starch-binding outer membrane protein, SusD/RagB family
MNKSILQIIVTVLISFLSFSCHDYLDIDTKGKVTEGEIQTNINNLSNQLAAVYSQLAKNDFERSLYRFGEMPGDNVTMQSSDFTDELLQLSTFTVGPTNGNLLTFWKACYRGIKASNDYLTAHDVVYNQWMEKVDEIYKNTGKNSPLIKGFDKNGVEVRTKDELTYMAGEARFLRALFYFYLVRTFGEVPIMPEKLIINSEGNNFFQNRAKVDSVYDYIEKDLRMAMATCRPAFGLTGNNELKAGRVTNAAAAAYLAKVIGYRASRGESHRWIEIPPITQWIYTDKSHFTYHELLQPVFHDLEWDELHKKLYLFKYDSISATKRINNVSNIHNKLFDRYDMLNWTENEFNQEIIFSINHVYTGDGTTNNSNRGTVIWHDLYNMGDIDSEAVPGSKIFSASVQFSRTYGIVGNADKDPRWATSTLGSGFIPFYSGISQSNNFQSPTPAHRTITKYFVNKRNMPQNRVDSDYPRNIILMRLAEVWLWEAEALNETGKGAEAIELVNRMRTRANKIKQELHPNSWDFVKAIFNKNTSIYIDADKPVVLSSLPVLSKEINRSAILRERGIELCFEFDRFYDLVRTNSIANACNAWNLSDGNLVGIVPKQFKKGVNEIFPIPQDEINKAGGRWIQNPGY